MRSLVVKKFRALGTEINIKLVAGDTDSSDEIAKYLDELEDFYQKEENIFSRFDPASELNFFNNRLEESHKASLDFLELSKRVLEYHRISRGYFDPRIIGTLERIGYDRNFHDIDRETSSLAVTEDACSTPLGDDLEIIADKVSFRRRMDYSGIAKGYITDRAAEFLRKNGRNDFLIDSGGDIYASGKDEFGEGWRIIFEGLSEANLAVELSGAGVATSGISRRKWTRGGKRFHHLVDPKDPERFSLELSSVSVVARNAEEADFWAKVLFLRGIREGLLLADSEGLSCLFQERNGNVRISREMKKILIN